MKSLPLFALALLVAPALAHADRKVTPGLWSYEANAALGPLPMTDVGTYCVDEAVQKSSFEQLLNDINPNCRVTDGAFAGEDYNFKLACKGGPDGELSGKLTVGSSSAQLNATGWTGTVERPVPVILSASAKKVNASCG